MELGWRANAKSSAHTDVTSVRVELPGQVIATLAPPPGRAWGADWARFTTSYGTSGALAGVRMAVMYLNITQGSGPAFGACLPPRLVVRAKVR